MPGSPQNLDRRGGGKQVSLLPEPVGSEGRGAPKFVGRQGYIPSTPHPDLGPGSLSPGCLQSRIQLGESYVSLNHVGGRVGAPHVSSLTFTLRLEAGMWLHVSLQQHTRFLDAEVLFPVPSLS